MRTLMLFTFLMGLSTSLTIWLFAVVVDLNSIDWVSVMK